MSNYNSLILFQLELNLASSALDFLNILLLEIFLFIKPISSIIFF